MSTLDELLDVGDQRREDTRDIGRQIAGYLRVGIWSVGWLLAKLVWLVLTVIAGIIFGVGWVCGKLVPIGIWAKTAFVLGYQAGRAPPKHRAAT